MKRFIKHIIYFSLVLSLGLLLAGFIQTHWIKSVLYSKETFKLDDNVDVVFAGDSHAMCAFNDSIVPNSFNAARNSESYFQTYNKLHHLIEANPQIKVIVLSYCPHNIAKAADIGILYGDRYFPLLDTVSRNLIINAQDFGLLKVLTKNQQIKSLVKHYVSTVVLTYKWDWGLPSNLDIYWKYLTESSSNREKLYLHPVFTMPYRSIHSNLSSSAINRAIKRHYGESGEYSSIMKSYLVNIIGLCESHQVKLVFVNTPQHTNYSSKIPLSQQENYRIFSDSIKRIYPKIVIEDFSSIPFNDSLYGDGDHLNYMGNIEFAVNIDSIISNFSVK